MKIKNIYFFLNNDHTMNLFLSLLSFKCVKITAKFYFHTTNLFIKVHFCPLSHNLEFDINLSIIFSKNKDHSIRKFAKIKDHIRTIGTEILGKYKDH